MVRQKSELVSALGRTLEALKPLSQEVQDLGGGDDDIVRAFQKDAQIRRKIAELIVGTRAKDICAITIDPSSSFLRNMKAKLRWTLESDLEYQAGEVSLELVEFLNPGEKVAKGTVMADRATKLGANLGQKHAEALLANQHLIPKEWREYYLVFPGTVWLDSDGDRSVPYLHWDWDQWVLDFGWLGGGWYSNDRLLRPRK